MSVVMRQRVEKTILKSFVRNALSQGYPLSVSLERGYDTEDMLIGSMDCNKIMDEAMAGDDCHIFIHDKGEKDFIDDGSVNSIGWVYFVWGNDGWDCMSDWTVNEITGELLEPALKLSDKYSDS